jgi:MFS family permease
VGSSLFPTYSYFSQILSKERRGTVAGLNTASIFIGASLIPVVYTPIYNSFENAGYKAMIVIAMIFSAVLIVSSTHLFLRAKPYFKVNNNNKD